MYPQRELIRLGLHKAALRRDIAWRRTQCAKAAARLARPFAWLDRALAFWRRLKPLAAIGIAPLGFLIARTVFPRFKVLGSIARWGPLVVGAVRGLTATLTKT